MAQQPPGGRGSRAGRGLVHGPGHDAAQHGPEVHHVPHAAPADQGGDAERALVPALQIDDTGAGHVPVATELPQPPGRTQAA